MQDKIMDLKEMHFATFYHEACGRQGVFLKDCKDQQGQITAPKSDINQNQIELAAHKASDQFLGIGHEVVFSTNTVLILSMLTNQMNRLNKLTKFFRGLLASQGELIYLLPITPLIIFFNIFRYFAKFPYDYLG